jgi:hypothetical protein
MPTFPGQVGTGETFSPHYKWLLSDTIEQKGVPLDPAARDALGGHTPTTTLRSGLVMGLVTATKKWKEYDDADADGTQVARGVLLHPVRLFDAFGAAAVSPVFGAIIIAGRVRASELYGYDAAAKTDLAARFIFEADYE